MLDTYQYDLSYYQIPNQPIEVINFFNRQQIEGRRSSKTVGKISTVP